MARAHARPVDAGLIVLGVETVERCRINRHLNRDREVARDKTLDCKSTAPPVLILSATPHGLVHLFCHDWRTGSGPDIGQNSRFIPRARSNDLADFEAMLDAFRLLLSLLRQLPDGHAGASCAQSAGKPFRCASRQTSSQAQVASTARYTSG